LTSLLLDARIARSVMLRGVGYKRIRDFGGQGEDTILGRIIRYVVRLRIGKTKSRKVN